MNKQEAGIRIKQYKAVDTTILDSHMGFIENNSMENQVEN